MEGMRLASNCDARIAIDRSLPLRRQPQTGHNRWHPDVPPALTVEPGQVVELETRDACDGQISPGSTSADILKIDGTRVHPLTGPVFVNGAEPGDLLEVDVLEVRTQSFGFTNCSSRYGILKQFISKTFLVRWKIENGAATSVDLPGVTIPAAPFMGVMGVAPSHVLLNHYLEYEGQLAVRGLALPPAQPKGAVPAAAANGLRTIPPRDNGGNIDVKQLSAGAVLLLPVFVPGALFSAGDGHFAQGDNECCTGIETGATLQCRFGLRKGMARARNIRDAQVCRKEWLPIPSSSPIFCTTGQSYARDGALTHSDLNQAARSALMNMIEHLSHEYGYDVEQAAVICSVAADLRISQAANDPNYLVTAMLPLRIFDGASRQS